METFITSICTEEGFVTTCEYGGVLYYSLILLFLIIICAISTWIVIKLVNKII